MPHVGVQTCITCGKTFRGRTLECKVCSGQALTDGHARRARKLAAEVAGPVPRSVYLKILASGPCVYCGSAADTVDHVRPLSRGGHEAEYNLVPACGPCNYSKHNRLLTEWDPVRVAHGAAQSFVVAAELGRELSGIQADLRHREARTQYMPLASALCLGMRPDVGQWNCAWRRGPARVTL